MTVSVIIPAFNEEKYIGLTLESLTSQTVKAHEIIVVDNNSTDATKEIALTYGARVVNESRQGMIYARDTGFNSATGDIIARTDADTQVPENWIERIIEDFTKHDIVALCGPAEYGSPLMTWSTKTYLFINKIILHHETLYGPNMALKKDLWDKIKDQVCIDDSIVHEDIDLSIHGSQFGKILYDSKLMVRTSARRVKQPGSLLFDYLPRWRTTLKHHSYK